MQITTTLNRLHKFIERLTAKNNELRQEIFSLASPVHTQLAKGMNTVPVDPEANSQKVVTLLTQVFEISTTICGIRTAVMKANTELGISALLVEQQQQGFSKGIVTHIKTVSDRNGYTSVATAKQMLMGLTMNGEAENLAVQIVPLTDGLIDQLDGILQEYTTTINQISDKVSDLNREKISVQIPESLLAIVGITGE